MPNILRTHSPSGRMQYSPSFLAVFKRCVCYTVSSLVALTCIMHHASYSVQALHGERCSLALDTVLVGPFYRCIICKVPVAWLLVPFILCNVAGSSPSVTSAPDRVFMQFKRCALENDHEWSTRGFSKCHLDFKSDASLQTTIVGAAAGTRVLKVAQ